VYDKGVILGAGFHRKDGFDGGGGEGVCTKAVDGFGREGNGGGGFAEEGAGMGKVGEGLRVGDVEGG